MLEFSKKVLNKVSFDKKLFKKEKLILNFVKSLKKKVFQTLKVFENNQVVMLYK